MYDYARTAVFSSFSSLLSCCFIPAGDLFFHAGISYNDSKQERPDKGGSMPYIKSSFFTQIEEDLSLMEGHREAVRVGYFDRKFVKKVPPCQLHVNPDDEFASPEVGPNDAIISNYRQIALRNQALRQDVFSDPIIVQKLREDGYLILNGHHRWAGAVMAHVPKVRITISNDGL